MARNTNIRLRRSATQGAIPTNANLDIGEVALNTYDGKLYVKKKVGQVERVVQVGSSSYSYNLHTGVTETFIVTVGASVTDHVYDGTGSSSKYFINDLPSPYLNLVPGTTYRFDQSDSSNSGHPLRFYYEADKTTSYSTGVTVSGTAGSAGAYVEIVATDSTPPVLHYQCTAHAYMGNQVSFPTRNFTGFDTDDLTEGSTNLYYTTARANSDFDTRLATKTTSDLSEGSNLYYTDTRARAAISAGTGITYNSTTGVISNTQTQYNDSDARNAISVTDSGGDGSLTYNSSTGVITYTGPSQAEVLAHISGGTGITVSSGGGIATTITQYTDSDARGAISVTDSGCDGSVSYDSGTGVITYTGPSASEVRAHFSAGTGVTISSGQISIGQAVATTDNVTFNDLIVSGNLTVSGTTTTIDSNTVNIGDNIIVLNSDEAGSPSQDAGIEIERGTSTNKTLLWDESNGKWTVGSETFVAATFEGNLTGNVTGNVTGQVSDISNFDTGDLTEGSNLYYTNARADARIALASIGDLSDVDITTNAPTSGQVLKWDGTNFVPGTDLSGSAASDSFTTIAVSGQSNVVADSSTDTLTLVAGTGMTITTDASTDTITLASTATGTVTETFKTFAVSGQSSIVADAAEDTFTFVAGSGITLATDANTDSLTITASGSQLAQSAVWTEYVYTATANQTTFTGTDDNSNTLSYTAASIQVFLNGVLQENGTDYTATNGTSVVLVNGASAGDILQVAAFVQVIGSGDANTDTFTGNGSLTAFTLTAEPNNNEDNTIVFIDGVYQEKSTYSVSGTTLTFGTAPPNTSTIEVITGSRNVTVADLNGLTVQGDLTVQGESFFTGDAEFTGDIIGQLRGPVSFKAQAGENISKGQVVYISGISGNTTIVSLADADDSAKMPAFGVAGQTANSGNPIDVINFGILSGINTSTFAEGDELFVDTTAGGLVNTAPTGESSALQKIAKVTRSDNSAGSIIIMGAGRSNAVPNLNTGRLFVGNASNQAVADDTLYVDIANSRVGIGTSNPAVTLDLGSTTDALRVPNGATGDRPTAAAGQIRYNTTTSEFEGYAAGAWGKIGGGGDSFGTIAVSGQSNVVAEQENDTLTLVGTNGVSITTDASTDTVTIDGRTSYTDFTTDLFTATASQTDYSLSVTPDTEDNLIVFVEGVYQNKNSYSLSGSTLTLSGAPGTGDEVVVHIIGNVITGQSLTRNNFTGDNSTTDFTLTIDPLHENNIFVYFDGVYQEKSEYSVSGTTLSFTTAPALNDSIEVIIPKATEIQTPSTNSINDVTQFNGIQPLEITSTTLTTTSLSTIATHSATTYRSVKYQIQCSQGTDYHITEINLLHDGTTAYITEYGTIFDNAALGTFDATISGGNILLQMTPGSNTSMEVKVISSAVTV